MIYYIPGIQLSTFNWNDKEYYSSGIASQIFLTVIRDKFCVYFIWSFEPKWLSFFLIINIYFVKVINELNLCSCQDDLLKTVLIRSTWRQTYVPYRWHHYWFRCDAHFSMTRFKLFLLFKLTKTIITRLNKITNELSLGSCQDDRFKTLFIRSTHGAHT